MMPIDLHRVKPGMVVAKPVHNSHGTVMLNNGTVLSEKNIWILKSWGVEEVWVREERAERVTEGDNPRTKEREVVRKEDPESEPKGLEDQVMMEIMRVATNLAEQRNYQDKKPL